MSEVLTDADGREIEVRALSVLERRRLIRNWGLAADIDRWVGEAMLAAHVRTLGGLPVLMPTTPDAADILVDKLGPAGMDAVATWLQANNARAAFDRDAVKNS